MPRKQQWKEGDWQKHHGKRLMSIGALLVILGILLRAGYGWDVIFIVAGALIFLKGLAKKFWKM